VDCSIQRLGYPDHFYIVVGVAEVFGAILLLIPRTVKLGAPLLIAVMAGATLTHLIHHEPQVATTVVLTALLVAVLYLRRRPALDAPKVQAQSVRG
jgi:uncharacterized membrane protein YphA (DoxX/SURF4 family)